jgi:hypothetical protein
MVMRHEVPTCPVTRDQIVRNCENQTWAGLNVCFMQLCRGVFATQNFTKGSVVCNYAGRLHDAEQLDANIDLMPENEQTLVGE